MNGYEFLAVLALLAVVLRLGYLWDRRIRLRQGPQAPAELDPYQAHEDSALALVEPEQRARIDAYQPPIPTQPGPWWTQSDLDRIDAEAHRLYDRAHPGGGW